MFSLDETLNSYDSTAQEYAKNVETFVLHKQLDGFVYRIMQNNSEEFKPYVVDLGCGSGRDLAELSKRNCKVMGVDFSEELLAIAKQNMPNAELIKSDMRTYGFNYDEFDGIWANASLLHIPKNEISDLIFNVYNMLKPKGVLFTSIKEGVGEEIIEDKRYDGNPRKFFAYYEKNEMEEILTSVGFQDIESEYASVDNPYMTHPFISIFAIK